MSYCTSLPMAQQQEEVEVPDLQSCAFEKWRKAALTDCLKETDGQQTVRDQMKIRNLSHMTPLLNLEPDQEPEGNILLEPCEQLYMEMKNNMRIKSGKARRDHRVSNTNA